VIEIDGVTYNIPIVSAKLQADMLDKYAERTADGVLHRELIGVFDNYEIQFGSSANNPTIYMNLWLKLTEPVPWHNVKLPNVTGDRVIEGYFSGTNHEILRQKDGTTYWKSLTTSFVSRGRRP
jgi:hypothetical protein